MKHILFILIMIPVFFSSEKQQQQYPPIIVLELFTSQGCSSCPPADKLLTKIQSNSSKGEVIALSYHVDYWNYIGWKDPFSNTIHSEKQRKYNRKFKNSSIYTPQVIVNGQEHLVGSNGNKMKMLLGKYGKISAENKIEISSIITSEDNVTFKYDILGTTKDKLVRIALVIEERVTKIPRGENKNRHLKNSNIVVAEDVLLIKNKNEGHRISIPELVTKNDKLKLILTIQNIDLDIVGATQVNL